MEFKCFIQRRINCTAGQQIVLGKIKLLPVEFRKNVFLYWSYGFVAYYSFGNFNLQHFLFLRSFCLFIQLVFSKLCHIFVRHNTFAKFFFILILFLYFTSSSSVFRQQLLLYECCSFAIFFVFHFYCALLMDILLLHFKEIVSLHFF